MKQYIRKTKYTKRHSIWSVYKGENEIYQGTFDELKELMNVNLDTLTYYTSKVYIKRLNKRKKKGANAIRLVLVEKIK